MQTLSFLHPKYQELSQLPADNAEELPDTEQANPTSPSKTSHHRISYFLACLPKSR